VVKGAWSAEEDELMKAAVAEHGKDWKKVSEAVPGRTSKQCRDRYKLKLDPTINHGPWTPEEDETLTHLQEQLGNQWTKIAKQMPGRTENSVKSRFASLERSRNREWTPDEDMILRSCREKNLEFQHISDRYLTKRSEHAIRKRWEKLFMRDLAKKIREELPLKEGGVDAPGAGLEIPTASPGGEGKHVLESFTSAGSTGTFAMPAIPSALAPPTLVSNNTAAGFSATNPSLFSAYFGNDAPGGSHSDRMGNIKRQRTSVTVLQQILGEPLKNL
jgi:hypothetical protein